MRVSNWSINKYLGIRLAFILEMFLIESIFMYGDFIICNVREWPFIYLLIYKLVYTHCFPIRNASIRNSTENLGFFKKWVVKTLQLRNEKTVPNKIKKCHYSQKIG